MKADGMDIGDERRRGAAAVRIVETQAGRSFPRQDSSRAYAAILRSVTLRIAREADRAAIEAGRSRAPRFGAVACLAVALAGSCAPAPAPRASAADRAPRYFGSTTPPDGQTLRFHLSTEPEAIDPALATGQPDGRVCRLLFEGLTREDPRTLEPRPGQASRWEVSADGLTLTFHLRPGLAWSDGAPLTAEDFRWSWLRVLTPKTAARNAGLLAPIENAEAFTQGLVQDPDSVGIHAPDDSTLIVRLRAPTAYFPMLTEVQTFMPVPRPIVERFGDRWTRPEHLVGNGAFVLAHWRQNESFEFTPNRHYWDAPHVRLERVVAYTADAINTATNMYKAGMTDWNPSGNIPSPFLPYLESYADYRQAPYQGIYFYSINVTRKPFDNVWVRRALNFAVDRDAIANDLLKGTKDGWGNFTPRGYPGYVAPPPLRYDPVKARECLARAGYPDGRGFPKTELLFRTSEDLRRIAEAVQAMWRRELHIDVQLVNQEFGSYMKNTSGLKYDVASRSWLGDYLDPNTFLACYVTGDGNNRTGWGDPRYDRLIHDAGFERDATRRLAMLHDAEALLLDQCPIIPIYHYTTTELVKPYVRGLYSTPLDVHPLTYVWIDHDWRRHAVAPDSSGAPAADSTRAAAATHAARPPAARPAAAVRQPPGSTSRAEVLGP